MRTVAAILTLLVALMGLTPLTMAQTNTDVVVIEGLALPQSHRYEIYNASTATYSQINVRAVPSYLQKKTPVYDRTAKVWVVGAEGTLDPRYAAGAGQTAANQAQTNTDVVVIEGLALPQSHRYEIYNASTATYSQINVRAVPSYLQKKTPVYDRTAKVWVVGATGTLDPRYAASAGQTAGNQSGEWQRIHGKIESIQGSSLSFRADDGQVLTVDMSRVAANVRGGLTQGEGVTIMAHEWTGPNALRAQYVQQDSSDPSHGGKIAPSASPR